MLQVQLLRAQTLDLGYTLLPRTALGHTARAPPQALCVLPRAAHAAQPLTAAQLPAGSCCDSKCPAPEQL